MDIIVTEKSVIINCPNAHKLMTLIGNNRKQY